MSQPKFVHCVGNPAFKPDGAIEDIDRQKEAVDYLLKNDLYNASRVLFQLPDPDPYTYHAITSVKLAQVQSVVNLGGSNGLHAWYRDDDGSPVRSYPSTTLEEVDSKETDLDRETRLLRLMLKHMPLFSDHQRPLVRFSRTWGPMLKKAQREVRSQPI